MIRPSLPLWLQRLAPERRRRLDVLVAAAIEARLDVHAEQALDMVAVLASRSPFDEAVKRYTEIMGLTDEDSQIVRTRALVGLAESGVAEELAREWIPAPRLSWRYATPLGAVRFVRRQMRRSAEEDLLMELAAARAEEALIRTHVRHALGVVDLLSDQYPPTRCVALYLEQLQIPSSRARSIYQRTLARVASVELPRLGRTGSGATGTLPSPHPPAE